MRAARPAVRTLFKDLIGEFAWSVENGFGTMVKMEFGQPHLRVREPIQPKAARGRARRQLLRRRVQPTGDWTFWIEYAAWNLSTSFGSASSRTRNQKTIDECLADLEGQRLMSVAAFGPGSIKLKFDLGAILEVFPSRVFADSDLWSLSKWNGDIVICQSDGTIVIESASIGSRPKRPRHGIRSGAGKRLPPGAPSPPPRMLRG